MESSLVLVCLVLKLQVSCPGNGLSSGRAQDSWSPLCGCNVLTSVSLVDLTLRLSL